MANLNTAPAELTKKALAARNKAKALLKKHKVGYVKAYSSYSARTGKVRMKLYGIYDTTNFTQDVRTKIQKLGFEIQRPSIFGSGLSITGYF